MPESDSVRTVYSSELWNVLITLLPVTLDWGAPAVASVAPQSQAKETRESVSVVRSCAISVLYVDFNSAVSWGELCCLGAEVGHLSARLVAEPLRLRVDLSL